MLLGELWLNDVICRYTDLYHPNQLVLTRFALLLPSSVLHDSLERETDESCCRRRKRMSREVRDLVHELMHLIITSAVIISEGFNGLSNLAATERFARFVLVHSYIS